MYTLLRPLSPKHRRLFLIVGLTCITVVAAVLLFVGVSEFTVAITALLLLAFVLGGFWQK